MDRTSKTGQRDNRRLLIGGAAAVVRWAARKGAPESSQLGHTLARKPKRLIAVALANRIARTVWALLRKGADCRCPEMVAAQADVVGLSPDVRGGDQRARRARELGCGPEWPNCRHRAGG
jgi:hypothetical protein